jgi:hypothetical protein
MGIRHSAIGKRGEKKKIVKNNVNRNADERRVTFTEMNMCAQSIFRLNRKRSSNTYNNRDSLNFNCGFSISKHYNCIAYT